MKRTDEIKKRLENYSAHPGGTHEMQFQRNASTDMRYLLARVDELEGLLSESAFWLRKLANKIDIGFEVLGRIYAALGVDE